MCNKAQRHRNGCPEAVVTLLDNHVPKDIGCEQVYGR